MNIPIVIEFIIKRLQKNGFASFIIGGAVRDFLLGKQPHDWDVGTTALPEQVAKLFPKTVSIGQKKGTVTVILPGGMCEVSTLAYRMDVQKDLPLLPPLERLRLDLGHRDFTVNALAYDVDKHEIIDYFGGKNDLLYFKTLRGVENVTTRFTEDPLRLLRAVRISNQLGLNMDKEVVKAIKAEASRLSEAAIERIRDEMSHILLIPDCQQAFIQLYETGLITYIIPELLATVGLKQGRHHCYDVFTHTIKACATVKPQLHLRLSALLHDIGKPATAVMQAENSYTFPQHHIESTIIANDILKRFHFPKNMTDVVTKLIKNHMFYYRPGTDDLAVLRKLIGKVGIQQIWDLIELRRADMVAMNPQCPDTHLVALVSDLKKVLSGDPLYSVNDLALSGKEICELLQIPPGPRVGKVLEKLLEMVQKEPQKNNDKDLKELVLNLYLD